MTGAERKLYRLEVTADAAGERLDRYLPDTVADLSRTQVRKVIDIGGVTHNGRRVRKCSLALAEGDRIEVHLDGLPLEPYRVAPDDVLYRDRYLLILNKPPLVDTQPTAARYKGTLYEAVLSLLGTDAPRKGERRPSLGMIQRLDRETSGAILFSTHPQAHRPLTRAFAERRVTKTYLALVAGAPTHQEKEIVSNLARTRDANRVKSVRRGGKEAVTRYRVLERYGATALLGIDILTGRSHQIRVHLAEAGHPLLGDRLYGGPDHWEGVPIDRTMLHSDRLALAHPVEGTTLDCRAPLYPDMTRLIERFKGMVPGND